MSVNPDAMNPSQGEFSSKVAPSEPLTTKGHAPGVKVGNDAAAPEFHAETHPVGTAPRDQTFEPQSQDETSVQATDQSRTSAADTLGGATSADVHQGLGKPAQGMSSQELHGHPHKRDGSGLEGVGANASDPIHERGFDRDHPTGHRGKSGNTENVLGAEERIPESAEGIAHERR